MANRRINADKALKQASLARTEQSWTKDQAHFLGEVSGVLASTIDYEVTLQNIVRLTVPFLADWCSIDVVNEEGEVRRVASAHINPAKIPLVHELLERFPYPPHQKHPLRDLLISGKSQFFPEFTEAQLRLIARSPEHFQILKELGLTSGINVPLIARGRSIGAFTLGMADSGRHYTEDDLALAEELARRAALAIDNAWLYRKAHQALAERSEAVSFHRRLEEQLTVLVEASDNLLAIPQLDRVVPAILDLSQRLIEADAYGVWRYCPESQDWRVGASTGLSESYQLRVFQGYAHNLPLDGLIVAEDVAETPALANRQQVYESEGIRSMLIVPLRIQGQVSGTIAFYYRQPHRFGQIEIRVATALANLAAAAIGTAELYEAQNRSRIEAELAQERLSFLAEASDLLASSLDYEVTLQNVINLAVPRLADWGVIDMPGEDGQLQQVALAPQDSEKVEMAHELRRRYPPLPTEPSALLEVMRTGQSHLSAAIKDEMLVVIARDAEHHQLLRRFGLTSLIVVPLIAQGQPLGTLTVASTRPDRHYDSRDVVMVQELANRAAVALDNARLYRQAQQAIEARNEFLSIAAHELKTPITTMQGYAQFLLHQLAKGGELKPERLGKALQNINHQSGKLAQLVSQLLDVSRLEAGRLILEPKPTDLTELIQGLVATIQANAPAHSLELKAPAQVTALIDPLRFEQVVVNLLNNAVKYSPQGGPVLVEITTPDENTVRVSVTDRGIGIAPEFRAKIFERFYQAHSQQHFSGMGLGLYISKQIIELHGGTIQVEFPPEGGTRFVINLTRSMAKPSV